jgi:hypothetical protein
MAAMEVAKANLKERDTNHYEPHSHPHLAPDTTRQESTATASGRRTVPAEGGLCCLQEQKEATMIYIPKASTIGKVPFLVVLVAYAIFLCLNSNHVVTAQRSDGPPSSTEPQAAISLDDQFAAIARAVPSFGALFIRDGQLNVYLTNPADLQPAMLAIAGVFGRTRLPLENPVALERAGTTSRN